MLKLSLSDRMPSDKMPLRLLVMLSTKLLLLLLLLSIVARALAALRDRPLAFLRDVIFIICGLR